jgi:tetratricopeptide (TPR) repeat protein
VGNTQEVGDAARTLERAETLFESADSASRLQEAIAAYDEALRSAPGSGAVLVRLAEAHILYGAAYSVEKRDKANAYITGIRYAEQALALNPEFRRRVEAGESLGAASAELGRDELRPMLFWVTGVSYYYKECLGGLGHLTQFRWMLRTREVMERMMALDPAYEHGAVPFSLAIYYIGLPASAGRDLARSADLLAQAVAESPTSLLTRWGRAKYLYVKTGDRAGFRRDLEWVLAQDPAAADSPLRWNVYFQRDARELLAQIEDWF